jgi:hypothetical protein
MTSRRSRWTTQQKDFYVEYEALPPQWRQPVDDAFSDMKMALEEHFGPLPKDDRAEALVADITRYVKGF